MRVAVLSDIHANLPALDAVLADAGPVDGIWHLGDVVGYGPDPDGVIEPAPGRGRAGRPRQPRRARRSAAPRSTGSMRTRGRPWSGRARPISQASVDWLSDLPERRSLQGCELVHGSFREPSGSTSRRRPIAQRQPEPAPGRAIGLHGHTHMPSSGRSATDASRQFAADGARLQLDGGRRSSTRAVSASRGTATRRRASS